MFILVGWRKDGEEKVIAINADRKILSDFADTLNYAANYTEPSEGVWDREEIKGRFWIEEIPDQADFVQLGIDFLNYNDKTLDSWRKPREKPIKKKRK
jgi:hypothetical protein